MIRFVTWLLICLVLLGFGFLLSVTVGIDNARGYDVIRALLGQSESKAQLIISEIRMPRVLVAALVGANLAVAGALMQAVTRNPFASPQILGVNSGAALAVVVLIVFLPALPPGVLVPAAFGGALLGGLLVFFLGKTNGDQAPIYLALAGIAVSIFLTALTEAIIVLYDNQTQNVLFWLAGAVHGGTWGDVSIIIPWTIIGLFGSILIARPINIQSLGDDIAVGLGQKVWLIRLIAILLVILLAGSAVAIAGPIGFVGLIIPHIVRYIIGTNYQLILPLAALFGSLLLVYADILSRYIAYPFESPVGIVTAGLGAPFFLYLVIKRR
jgi:ABC-type Fe3+-siderophore transport system permease subunit